MMPCPRAPKGFTLIEVMVAVAILGILVTLAAPSFNSFIDKYRVKRAADSISAFLVSAKSEAIKQNKTVRAVFQSAGSGVNWCVGMTSAASCDCTAVNSCQFNLADGTPDGADRVLRGGNYPGIVLENPVDGAMFSFLPLRGTVNSGNARVRSANGLRVQVVVSGRGRIKLCSPSGAGNVGGYPVC
jgi:prepilin-type N-terminal cleavage/methylation domain-containing protein